VLGGWFASGPWKIEVYGNHVYFAEFFDGDIVRFDKTMRTQPQCQSLDSGGNNPCMSELHVPGASVFQTKFHNNRMYFTSCGVRPDECNLGYVNLSDWYTGVLYTGMSSALVDPARLSGPAGYYTWLDIDPGTGKIAVGDFARRQLIRLQPK
jgi:hypothetical protein